MRLFLNGLLAGLLVGSSLAAVAQTAKPVARPTTKSATPKATQATKSAPKPVVKSTPQPATQPAAKPTPTPIPASTPPASTSSKFEIPGIGRPQPVAGKLVLNLGIGVGSSYTYGFGSGIKSSLAYSLSGEREVLNGLGPGTFAVGGMIGYQGFHYDYPGGSYQATFDHFVALARGSYHYNFDLDPRLDTYGGVSLGLRYVRYRDTYLEQVPNGDRSYGGAGLAAGLFVGARYFLTDAIGAFGELGYDMTYLKFGVTAKF